MGHVNLNVQGNEINERNNNSQVLSGKSCDFIHSEIIFYTILVIKYILIEITLRCSGHDSANGVGKHDCEQPMNNL